MIRLTYIIRVLKEMGKIEEGGEANLLKFLKEKHRVSVQGKARDVI
ncbi:unnamed protein product [Brassica oleracea var. botrytis]|uniref:Uncharacterized protein n=1 Tax=Brassica oleracea TaxID=3712 RepID=A0A3P6D0C0_BRAOL|nr:unnamed protein product [Brassica oleracea]